MQVKPRGSQLDIPSIATDISNDPTAIGAIAGGITSDPGAIAALDADYIRVDGTNEPGVSIFTNDAGYQVPVVPTTAGDFATLDASGDITDSGVGPADFQGLVVPASAGDFATLDVSGLLTDSGVGPADFATAIHTHVEADITDLQAYLLPADIGVSVAAFVHVHDTADITTGTFADARIAASNVTQHEAALTITESQISDLAHIDAYTKSESDATAGTAGAKADKVAAATNGNFAGLDATGNLTDSGSDATDFATAIHTHVEADITDLQAYLLPADIGVSVAAFAHTHSAADIASGTFADARISASNVTQHEAALTITESQISDLAHVDAYTKAESDGTAGSAGSKTDKVAAATNGNFAGLDATGNLTDSGSAAADFATASHTHVEADITDLDKYDTVGGTSGNIVQFGAADTLSDSGVATSSLATTASPSFTGVPVLPTYTVGTLPAVGSGGGVIFVSDATGASLTGSQCFSNGTVWVDTTTGAAVV